jgi:tetratricopeptide (TPR) repeat protein
MEAAAPATFPMMLADNLCLFFGLFQSPVRTMGRIVDEGSILFGVGAVVVVGLLMSLGTALPMYGALRAPLDERRSVAPATGTSAEPPPRGTDEVPSGSSVLVRALIGLTATSVMGVLFGIAVLYVPACILVLTFLAPVGSFGVAFQRDYGALLACALFSWAAAELPFAILGLALPGLGLGLRAGLWAGTALVFGTLMVVAIRTVFGVGSGEAVAGALLGGFGLALAPLAPFVASPFLLYLGWQYFRGDIASVQWAFGRRQSFKRHLEAATLNPRDADAHYHLGLIHQQRRQIPEAIERFRKAVEIDAGELDAHYQLGRIARGEKRYEDAIRHFGDVVKRDEKHARHEVWREIGATYLESGTLEHARWALDKFVAARPHDPEGLYWRGEALSSLGEAGAAQEAYRLTIEAVDTMPAYRHEVSRWKKLARRRLTSGG